MGWPPYAVAPCDEMAQRHGVCFTDQRPGGIVRFTLRFFVWAGVLLVLIPGSGAAQQAPLPQPANSLWKADPADVGSLDAIMKATYDVISGPAGGRRNWDRMRSLFVPGARLGPAVQLPSGEVVPRIGTLDEW